MRVRDGEVWPELPLDDWEDTLTTLHLWTQIVGKVRLRSSPLLNHWWQAVLYVTPRGLTTGPVFHGHRSLEIRFDLLDHRLVVETSDGGRRELALAPMSVASFHREVLAMLRDLDCEVPISPVPNELPEAVPFERDEAHRSHDAAAVERFHAALVQADRVMQTYRSWFLGKSSPVHLFWGSLDLAVTRFSGRRAPQHPGGVPHLPDRVTREAYSHEVMSVGFWPGHGGYGEAAFYAYAYPEPPGFRSGPVGPVGASYSDALREWVLPYQVVRGSVDPDATLLAFLQSTYALAADLAGWDREALERDGQDLQRLTEPLHVELVEPPGVRMRRVPVATRHAGRPLIEDHTPHR